eukprot:evm.model.scf_576.6 EVM.evm.TU.scf_576.6   scf_576:45484-53102(+)
MQVGEKADAAPVPTLRKDYKPPPYLIDQVYLEFLLGEDFTTVKSKLHMVPNYGSGASPPALSLNGRPDMSLESLKIEGKDWPKDKYVVANKRLTIDGLPQGGFLLEAETKIKPQENTLLEGLYKTDGNFCTQCEAEGFRGITFFLDRPDVMAKYNVRIEAEKDKYPVLLSNGNLVQSGELDQGRHFAVWDDPFPKPCYLFALVAGDLAKHDDKFTTMSGKQVDLRIFTQHHNIHKVPYAMQALKDAMKWDEVTFGLEYDLDLFNIVAIDDFNMGAMENKSLNVFNSRFVLALPETATDTDFMGIQAVVGHEYFHNWTGNRVTCQDWFQLTLKEGLTVYRDQEFSSDMNSRPVERIDNVKRLRSAQFPQDSGPMAHPVRPESYIKMDNFYTTTVYEKGAEVIRLYQTVLGRDGFRKGMDLYFQRHDGQAVTCDDFLAAMADANGKDLSSLGRWYAQAGTPQLTVSVTYDAASKEVTVKAKQLTPPTPGQDLKAPVLIPIAIGLLGPDGKDLPLKMKGTTADLGTTAVLEFDKAEDTFVFTDVLDRPVPSILRDFSAPVKLTVEGQTDEDLTFLFGKDSDPFNRWEAGQRLCRNVLFHLYNSAKGGAGNLEDLFQSAGGIPDRLVEAFRSILTDPTIDGQFMALATTLPSQSELIEDIPEADPVLLHEVCSYVKRQLAGRLEEVLEKTVLKNDTKPGEPFVIDGESMGRRAIKNHALVLLASLKKEEWYADCLQRFRGAGNMTDAMASLAALNDCPTSERDTALSEFYEKWSEDKLVCLKWLALMASSNLPGNIEGVRALLDHPAYSITNPNCNYSLLIGFTFSAVNFHAADGSGYKFLADGVINVDKVNPQVAARIAQCFSRWRQFDKARQGLIQGQLKRILATEGLSENTFEIISKSLED